MKKMTVSLLFMLIFPSLVFSHSPIKEAVPSSGDVLVTSPQNVSLTFSKPIEPAFSGIEVFHQDGSKVSEEITFSEDNMKIQVGLKGTLASGEYTVKWKCMSLDGHSKSGQYKFTVK
jgi:methionine-rich copper-binding protein CopC